jgi:hypothetical protein
MPYERNFSSINILYSKSRTRLTLKRVNKMLYIQINRRTLNRDTNISILDNDAEQQPREEEPEEPIIEAQVGFEDAPMSSQDEL